MKRNSTTRLSGRPAGAGGTYGKSDFSRAARRSKFHQQHAEDTAVTSTPSAEERTANPKEAAERALRGDIARPFKDTGSI